MARPLRIEYPGAYYHITSRGNERKDVFKNYRDREKFLGYLETAGKRYGAVIHVYCLMTNHYHLLLETPRGNLSQIMRHVNGAYTIYFNKKRERAGHLFQGRYRAILINADEYAQELSRYIHLNPVRAGMVSRPEDHAWSSYCVYIGQEKKPDWLAVDFVLNYFGKNRSVARSRYREFVTSLIGKSYESPIEKVVASTILGNEDFVERIRKKYLPERKDVRNVPALSMLSEQLSLEDIMKHTQTLFQNEPRLSRKVALYISHRYSGRKLKDIGSYFDMGESAVSQASSRFASLIKKDQQLRKRIEQVNRELNL